MLRLHFMMRLLAGAFVFVSMSVFMIASASASASDKKALLKIISPAIYPALNLTVHEKVSYKNLYKCTFATLNYTARDIYWLVNGKIYQNLEKGNERVSSLSIGSVQRETKITCGVKNTVFVSNTYTLNVQKKLGKLINLRLVNLESDSLTDQQLIIYWSIPKIVNRLSLFKIIAYYVLENTNDSVFSPIYFINNCEKNCSFAFSAPIELKNKTRFSLKAYNVVEYTDKAYINFLG